MRIVWMACWICVATSTFIRYRKGIEIESKSSTLWKDYGSYLSCTWNGSISNSLTVPKFSSKAFFNAMVKRFWFLLKHLCILCFLKVRISFCCTSFYKDFFCGFPLFCKVRLQGKTVEHWRNYQKGKSKHFSTSFRKNKDEKHDSMGHDYVLHMVSDK